MVLLKAEQASALIGDSKVFNLNDIQEEARQLILRAQQDAEQLLDQARQQCQCLHDQAREQGYEQGYQLGLEEGRETGAEQALAEGRVDYAEKTGHVVEALTAGLEGFDAIKDSLLWQAEQETVRLALRIAQKVIRQAGLLHSEVTLANVKDMLHHLDTQSNLCIRVNPQDHDYLRGMMTEANQWLSRFGHVEVVADETITPGGACVDTARGHIDARLETQIGKVACELLSLPEQEPQEYADDCGHTDNRVDVDNGPDSQSRYEEGNSPDSQHRREDGNRPDAHSPDTQNSDTQNSTRSNPQNDIEAPEEDREQPNTPQPSIEEETD